MKIHKFTFHYCESLEVFTGNTK